MGALTRIEQEGVRGKRRGKWRGGIGPAVEAGDSVLEMSEGRRCHGEINKNS